jgi:deoxyribose-phosphate aldolase
MIEPVDLAAHIEAMVCAPEASGATVHKAAADAMRLGLAVICVAPTFTARVATMLRGSGVRICSLVAFPSGTSKATIKAIESTSTLKDGADEIELVAHLPYLLAGDLDSARAELMEIVRAARSTRRDVVIRVIVETALLLRGRVGNEAKTIELACRAVRESGCDGIVTSSGVHPAGGASAAAVALLKSFGEGLMIKAAGGIADAGAARALLAAGADRIGVTEPARLLEAH